MALFDPFDAFEVGAFLLIFGLLAIGMGSASSFSSLPLESGFSQFLSIPTSILESVGATGSLLLLAVAALLFVTYFKFTYEWFGEAFWAFVLFGALVVMLHA